MAMEELRGGKQNAEVKAKLADLSGDLKIVIKEEESYNLEVRQLNAKLDKMQTELYVLNKNMARCRIKSTRRSRSWPRWVRR